MDSFPHLSTPTDERYVSAKQDVKAAIKKLKEDGIALFNMVPDQSFYEPHFLEAYQSWYTSALRIVSVLAPDRLQEFRSLYEPDPKRKSYDFSTYTIRDYVMDSRPTIDISTGKPRFNVGRTVKVLLANQLTIVGSLESRIDGVLANVEASVISDLEDATLATAKRLSKISLRAAGALAGVVLEEHLQRLAANRKTKIVKSNPTIGDLNDPLKDAGVYDIATWRKVQHLGDIRNLSTHKKGTEPTVAQIDDMIDGVSWVIRNSN